MGLNKALHLVQEAEYILEDLRLSVLEKVADCDQEMLEIDQVLLDALAEVGVMKGLLVNNMNE
jgi:hypothetical protein